VDQPSATTPVAASEQPPQESQPAQAGVSVDPPGFGSRGRVRRRARFLRKARELAYRDLGGLVFNLHRFGRRNDELVLAKLSTLSHIDSELRALESALSERETVTILREAGITACPRCAAIHSGDDRFCPNCGLPMSRHSNLPIAGAPASSVPSAPAPAAPAAAPAPAAPSPATAVHATTPSPPTFAPVPAPAAAPPSAAPPPSPGAAPGSPATQSFATVSPAGDPETSGSHPPAAASSSAQPASGQAHGADEQPTEIIRAPATGS
jgi:hypothetical protein